MDEETFVAAARYDVAQIDPELVDDYERAGAVLAPLPRARALLAQAARGEPPTGADLQPDAR